MRVYVLLASTSFLAACGGGGAQTIASAPPPVSAPSNPSQPDGPNSTQHTFANPTQAKTYKGLGGNHLYEYLSDERECCDQQGQLYAGNTTTPRNSSMEIKYDPADAIFTLTINDNQSGIATSARFQDPASRTDFDGNKTPQWGTPEFANPNVRYLQAGEGDPRSGSGYSGSGFVSPGNKFIPPSGTPGSAYQATSLFVIQPGTETQYVTLGGFARNDLSWAELVVERQDEDGNPIQVDFDAADWTISRGVFAYGENTGADNVPTVGTGSYSGTMWATMVFNPTIDGQDPTGLDDIPTYFQWIEGTAALAIDFAAGAFTIDLDGSVMQPQYDYWTGPRTSVITEGAQFTAAGRGDINLISFGGFKGFFDSASFDDPVNGRRDVNIAGSTVDGAFYGPNADEVGGGFRIVGGNPDERVDILGGFIGGK